METKKFIERKQRYIDAWTNRVKDFYLLALCKDETLAKEVEDCINRLETVIPKIAETKKLFSEGCKNETA